MIQVKNLSKTYVNGGQSLTALKDVSFTLPDTGLVFIVGKSGSGKSTLINMLGGLDDITDGQVLINNFDLSKANTRQLDRFRNNYLGIVYQNYNLFENETIEENIKIGSTVTTKKTTDQELETILKEVDLEKGKKELVMNLSGGQKQRVAIARALVKDAKLILADEPTGNLDAKTAKTIFKLFQKISKGRLIVIITHDFASALIYADRIIELSDGKIVSDRIRNIKDRLKTTKYLELETNQQVSDEELSLINDRIKLNKVKVVRKDEHFVSTTESELSPSQQTYSSQPPKIRSIFKNGLKLLKRNKVSFIISALLMMLVIGLMSISSSFINFDGKATIADIKEKYQAKNLVIRKGYSQTNDSYRIDKDKHVEVTSEDEQKLIEKGYRGNRYTLYPQRGTINFDAYAGKGISGIKYENFYAEAVSGLIACDEAYLNKVFGNVEVLAGSIYGLEGTTKLIITDFVADSLLFFNEKYKSPDPNDPYAKIVDDVGATMMSFGAVIKTNYKEKYETFLDTVERIKREPQRASQLRKAVTGSELFTHFLTDANSYLNYTYTLDPNFQKTFGDTIASIYLWKCDYSTSEIGPKNRFSNSDQMVLCSKDLTGNEIKIDVSLYNEIYGTNLANNSDPAFVERDLWIHKNSEAYVNVDVLQESVKCRVVGLEKGKAKNHDILVSREFLQNYSHWDMHPVGWVFDEVSQCYDLYDKLTQYYFYNYVTCFKAVFETIDIIQIFSQVFEIMFWVFLAILTLIIVMHNLRVIKREQYRFGVLKSLGYNNLYLTVAMLVLNIFSIAEVFVISTLFSWLAGLGINSILQYGFSSFFGSTIYYSITMISFEFVSVFYYSLIVLGLMFVSSFVPLLAIRNIKPSKIIRNAE